MTAIVVAAGIFRRNIKYLVDKGMIEKQARGVYILPEVWDDEIFNLQSSFKRGIYSHETALLLWDFNGQDTEQILHDISGELYGKAIKRYATRQNLTVDIKKIFCLITSNDFDISKF